MTDIVERLRDTHPKVSADVYWRIKLAYHPEQVHAERLEAADEIEKLRKVIIRAKDALLDGQSTQWVHDVLVAALLGHKP